MILNFKSFVQSSVIIGFLFFAVTSCGDNLWNKNTEKSNKITESSSSNSDDSRSKIDKLLSQSVELTFKMNLLQSYLQNSNSYLFNKDTLIHKNVNFGDIDKILDHISVPVRVDALAKIWILNSYDGNGNYSDIMGIPYFLNTLFSEYRFPYPNMRRIIEEKGEIRKQIAEIHEILETAKEKISTEINDSPGKQLILNGGKNKEGKDIAGLIKLSQMAQDARRILK